MIFLTKKNVHDKYFFVIFMTNPFQPNTMIYSMMTMAIIFLALLLIISFHITKEWKIQSFLMMNTLTVM